MTPVRVGATRCAASTGRQVDRSLQGDGLTMRPMWGLIGLTNALNHAPPCEPVLAAHGVATEIVDGVTVFRSAPAALRE